MRCLLLLIGFLANPISAATLFVSNTNDSGPGSLRSAIFLAATNLEEDTIVFDPVVFFTQQTISLESGELLVSPDRDLAKGVAFGLSVIGPGSDRLTIDAGRKSRIFHSEDGPYTFSVSGVTLTRGAALRGGAIYSENSLRVLDSVIIDNSAIGYAESPDPPGGAGGGVFADSYVISNSVINENKASGIVMTNVQFPIQPTGTSGRGGGVYGDGFLINCTLTGNLAIGENAPNVNDGFGGRGGEAYGGAAFSPTQLYVINSRFVDNHATGGNGATVPDGTAGDGGETMGGALRTSGGRIANSVFIGNSALAGNGGKSLFVFRWGKGGVAFGGALAELSSGKIANITAVENEIAGGDGRIPGEAAGGGIYVGTSPLNIINSTITGNRVEAGTGSDTSGAARGGGVFTRYDDVVTRVFKNNIVADNLAPIGPDLYGDFFNSFNNLIGIGEGTTSLTHGVNGNLVGTFSAAIDPRLGPLMFNGGITETRALLPDSSAINSGNNSLTDPWFHSAGSRSLLYDQRGFERISPIGGRVDIGAYELGSENLVSASTPDLQVQSDTGTSNQDNITKSLSVSLDVANAIPGARVELLREDTVVASSTYIQIAPNSSVITLTDPNPPSDGAVHYRTQQVLGSLISQSSNPLNVKFDNTPPTGSINQAATQSDPTTQSTIHFTALFNEAVEGPGSLSFVGSTANVGSPPLIVTSSDQMNFDVGVWGFSSDGGTVTANLAVFKDLAGNIGTALPSTDNSITVDNVRPRVTLNQAVGQTDPTIYQPLLYDVIFSEPVSGFTSSDILLMSSTPNLPSAVIKVEGSGAIYRVAVSKLTPSGAVRAWVVASAAQDSFGNLNLQSTFTDNSVTLVLPASLSGRVVDSNDRGLRNALVTITNSQNVTISMPTSSLGFYSFTDIPAGTYSISVNSKRYRFENRVLMVSGDLSAEDFKGLE